ncbi:MAG TPA: FAD-dependent oxidoreductase [Streptosporangiaceae bacterium]|nr:FAD-dependent oxidoreductase [Streptosporangiaceae bacterium]
MAIPVLLVVDDNPDSLKALDGVLRHRYGRDYLIISEASPGTALGRLRELRAAGRPVAVVMAAGAMTAAPGAEFLAQARGIQPGAKRVLVVPRGGPAAPSLRVPVPLVQDRQAATPVLRAIAHGMIDTYLLAPGAGRDEGFHRGVSELLEEWAHDAAPAVPAVRIIAQQRSARAHELRDTLARNSIPYVFHAVESADGKSWLQQAGQDGSALPVLVTYTGEVLVDPPKDQIAAIFGLAGVPAGTVDVAIVGAGPAGLSAAVYAASEGLSTLLLEREAFGGQAGSSSLIRNYLGFPRGISGTGLASRAFEQAWSFGAIPSMAGPVTGLEPAADGFTLHLAGGAVSHARSVLITTGVSYRRLRAPGVDSLLGAGVFYGATTSEATAFAGEHVFIAGGANSAGQAAVNLARYAQQVTIVVRGDSLAARMSQYLIDEITATANIDVRSRTHIAAAGGTGKLETLTLTDTKTGRTETVPAAALVVLIGAMPHTDWLPPRIHRDGHGFVVTGSDLADGGNPAASWTLPRPPFPLETSLPGVFAAGDVRHGSVKRVASAVGEGSIATTQVTQYLQQQSRSELPPVSRTD